MQSLKAAILDDEQKACKLLQLLIEEVDPDIKIEAVYSEPKSALRAISSLDIDVLFLDIDMPGMNGFEFLNQLDRTDIEVIFVTGYDQYALKALQLAAIGYILKPINIKELEIAISNLRFRIDKGQNAVTAHQVLVENYTAISNTDRKIGIPTVMGIDFVRMGDLLYCQGEDKYTKIFVDVGKEILSSYNIAEFVKTLPKDVFFQSHRSYIVNINKVKQYQKDGTLILDNGHAVPVARRRKDEFLKAVITLRR